VAFTILFFWLGPLDVFNFPKTFVLTTGIIALLITAIMTRFNVVRQNLSKSVELFLLGSMVILVLGAATHNLLDHITLWGQFGRANGILPRLCVYLVSLLYLWFGNSNTLIRFLRVASCLLFLEVIYGFIQSSGSDPISWNNPYQNIFLTTGNPNFASSLVALLTILNIIHLLRTKSRKAKISLLVLSLLGVMTVYQTKSIQGLILLSFAAFLGVFLFTLKSERRFTVKAGFITLIFSLGAFVFLGLLNIGPLNSLLFQETLNVRFHYWRVAFRIIQDHPWTGVGIDRYGEYFRLYRDPSFVEKYGLDLISNNAHNVALQWGTDIGILGVLIYVGLLIVPSWIYFKQGGLNPKKKFADSDSLYIVYICFYLQSLISISQVSVGILGYAVLGNLLMSLRIDKALRVENEMPNLKSTASSISKFEYVGIGTWWIFFVALLSIITSIPIKYDLRLANAISLPGVNQGISDLSQRSEAIKKATEPFLDDDDYLKIAIRNLFDEGAASMGFEIARLASQKNPNSWLAYQSLVLGYSQSGKPNEAVQSALKALELDPLNYNIMINIAMQAQKAGQLDVAKEFNKRALASAPIDSEALKNAKILDSILNP
jgi:O-antigen ligase